MEASIVYNVKVGRFPHLEETKTSLSNANETGTFMSTVQGGLIVSVTFMYYCADYVR
jgi:hypothetical protein